MFTALIALLAALLAAWGAFVLKAFIDARLRFDVKLEASWWHYLDEPVELVRDIRAIWFSDD